MAASAAHEPTADLGEPVPPQPGILAPWRGGGACDPTGTWRIELSPQQHLCDPMPKETFDLAIGFVRKDDRTVLAAVGRPVSEAGQVGGRMQSMQVSLLAGPYAGCEVRMHSTLGRADWATETDLLFSVTGKELRGLGVQWNAPHGCPETFLLLGERSSPTPAAWARLGEPAPPLPPADPRPPNQELADAVAGISAETVLGPAIATLSVPIADDIVDDQPVRTPLRGSIVEFVTALVGQTHDVSLHEVACSLPHAGRCVAVVGDPCRPERLDPETDWDCEGMYLVVVVDVDRKRLDRADTGGFPVRSHRDVAEWERIAP
ncbi:hypothetical protein OV203_24875 [Nannocystis sp. ILAH1]|uniref:hypothetical protein n=1 Tax=Nannocystis sp. ILAH1 TaxID=2996789 RepID=UPI00226F624A|nr:hypothetical protein [Nannocystis sp. ILAH1]MCY0990398.1 hypothetical protein [Nannocystis sp. ILAH1]